MKKQSTHIVNGKWTSRVKSMPVFAGTSAIAADYLPVRPKLRKKYIPKPRLEKIGGMDKDVRDYITNFADLSSNQTSIFRTSIIASIDQLPKKIKTIINLKRVNDIKEINKFFHTVNQHLPQGGTFISCVETKYMRKQRLYKKFPPVLNKIYYILDFIFKRVFPKLPVLQNIYNVLTGGRNRVLSHTETLGRLYAAGFQVKDKKFIGHNLYFVATKVKDPLFDYEKVYGPIFIMRRHGINDKTIHIYKMRTMHAYSEYVQQYVYEKNKLAEGGKLKDDFRISSIGKFFRRYWIDELPMIINLFKGDLKIVGVRPLSAHYLSLYADSVKQKRSMYKPGLVPPFYADLPKTLDEIQASEMKYLSSYEKNPLLTDIRYFCMAIYNILIKRARSK